MNESISVSESKSNKKEKTERSDAYTSKTLEGYLNLYRYRVASHFVKKAHLILDVGTGCGYGVHYLNETLNSDLSIGIDVSNEALKYANNRYKGERRYFIHCSATHLPLKNESFDLITCFEVIEHIRFPSKVLKEIHRVLKNEGTLIISTPNKRPIIKLSRQKVNKIEIPKNPFHIYEYSISEFKELLRKAKFDIIHKMGIYTPIPTLRKNQQARNSYFYSRLTCHAFSFLQPLCVYQLYVCKLSKNVKVVPCME